jgi:membrane protease YdiL (CAAX protease family)
MRKFAILEPLLMFGLIIAYIWSLRFVYPACWVVIPALMCLSHVLHRESPRLLGFTRHNLRICLNHVAPVLILTALVLVSAGALLGTLRPIGFGAVVIALAGYLPWGLAQQYALNGYFLNRFGATLSPRAASGLAALLFTAAHAPNPFLMALTLPLGWCATLLYRRTRNLYALGIAHAALGMLLYLTVPDSLSRHLRVGPRWFRP